ncbi:hypothetical protein M501DRAFT_1031468 [Patellaria atrata CBS 101060]|uniref:Zn(2)-C6 fungal-type domain-containing protein n=1 Tax=Patellaria atrata CBS 101060 TaxID=1346257 RepID=A0A9P4SB14_9PEZI|nr:hypothetical protein M501DRAFT_1031468 [Patellaria atrata CBS 101060]
MTNRRSREFQDGRNGKADLRTNILLDSALDIYRNTHCCIISEESNTSNSPPTSLASPASYAMNTQIQSPNGEFSRPGSKQTPFGAEQNEDSNPSGEDSEAGEENGDDNSRKRKRPMSVSCELCKQRKVRCDRGQPACGWCVRNKQLCEYKERKKPGLRAGYGKELEARLDRIDNVVQRHEALFAQIIGTSSNHAPQQFHQQQQQQQQHDPSIYPRRPSIHNPPHLARAETALFYERPSSFTSTAPLASEYGGIAPRSMAPTQQISATIQRTNGYGHSHQASGIQNYGMHIPLTSQFTHPNLAAVTSQHAYSTGFPPVTLQEAYSQLNNPLQPRNSSIGIPPPTPVTTVPDDELPPHGVLFKLTELFFKHIGPWCPILHMESFVDALFGPSASRDEADRILLHAIVATTLRFLHDPALDQVSRERYRSIAEQKVWYYSLKNTSVKSLQALVILAVDLVGSSNESPGRKILALIAKSIVELGLHTEMTSSSVSPKYVSIYTLRAVVLPEPQDWLEDESRRRLLWMTYVLDRYANLATSFEFSLDEKEIDRMLPCREELFSNNHQVETRWFKTPQRADYSTDRPENLGPFSYYIEIVGILSQIHQFHRKPVDIRMESDVEQWKAEYRRLDTMISAWVCELPTEYANIIDGSAGRTVEDCMLRAAYHTTVIRLHSSAAYATTRSAVFKASAGATARCLSAVSNLSELCSYVRSQPLLPRLGPHFAFSLWVAARVLLVDASTRAGQVSPSIDNFVDALKEMGAHWQVAARYATLLSRVLDEYRESNIAPILGQNGERVTPSSVKILADMRRTAFDLDLLISRQPQARGDAALASRDSAARRHGSFDLALADLFNEFNLPRLPESMRGYLGGVGVPDTRAEGSIGGGEAAGGQRVDEFSNIENYLADEKADWLGTLS